MKQPASRKDQAFATCTLKELCPEDKQKVAKLVKQVVELGQENQRLRLAAEQAANAAEDKVKQVQRCNKEAMKENCTLKNKLGQAVTVLRMYHHKVCGLDAALRALQHTQAEQPSATGCISQLENQQQQQAADSPSLAVVTADVEQQQQLPTLNLHVEAQTLSAEAPAAQKAAGQLLPHSEQLTLKPVAPQQDELVEVSTPARPSTKQTGQGSTASTAMHLMATPLVVPVHALGGQQLLQELARWQVQQGLAPAEATAEFVCSKVLQFDPSIGSQGAFIVEDQPQPSPQSAANAATAGAQAARAMSTNQQHHQPQQHQQQQPPDVLPKMAPLVFSTSTHINDGVVAGGETGNNLCINASPWRNPTCKQLFSIASTFNSLAASDTASPSLAAATSSCSHQSLGIRQACTTTSTTALASCSGLLHCQTAEQAGHQQHDGPLLPCYSKASRDDAGAVEEVAVEAVEAYQLPGVVVQKEKSFSSVLGATTPASLSAASAAAAAAFGGEEGVTQRHPFLGPGARSSRQHQCESQPVTALSLEQEMSGAAALQSNLSLCSAHRLPDPEPWPEPWPLQQQQQVHRRAMAAQEQLAVWQQAAELQAAGDQRPHGRLSEEVVLPGQVSWLGSSSFAGASSCSHEHLLHHEAVHPRSSASEVMHVAMGLAAKSSTAAVGASAAGSLQCSTQSSSHFCHYGPAALPPQQLQVPQQATGLKKPQQQYPLGCLSSTVDSAAAELLERFDDSLVDLLADVEGLQHQQEIWKEQLRQQQPAGGPVQCGRRRQHDQHFDRLQMHNQAAVNCGSQQSSVRHSSWSCIHDPVLCPAYGGWQHQQQNSSLHWQMVPGDEDDVVSDILNHLD